MAWARRLALLWLACLALVAGAAEPVALPSLQGRVTDLTGTLDANGRERLESLLAAVERDRGTQIAILLLPSTQPETIEAFGIRLAEAWKIGRKGADNGLIIIVAKEDRRMRIEVGYGLEGAVPDAVAKRVIADYMAPRFKQGDFPGGLVAAVEALETAIASGGAGAGGGPAPSSVPSAADIGGEHTDWIQYLFFLVVGAGVLHMIFGLLGSFAAAALGGWLGFMVFGTMPMAIGAGVLIFLLSFVNLLSGGRGGGGISGGGFSSDSGGFSGGGGSFGGGGASGDW